MKEDITMAGLMVKNHIEIEKLVGAVEENLDKDFKLANRLFNKLKWELEKHFFIEEKAIFIYCDLKSTEDNFIISSLLREHKIILELLNDMENDLTNNSRIDISKFKEILMKHKNFEDRSFYPKLDKGLNELQREIVIDRINGSFPEEYWRR